MKIREVRITGGADTIRQTLQQMVDDIDDSETDDVEVELQVDPNVPGEPQLLLHFNSTDTDEDDLLLVEYEEIDTDD